MSSIARARTVGVCFAALIGLVLVQGLSAAGGAETSGQPTVITMYLIGDPQPDANLVYTEVNKKLKTDINATVDVKYLPWADWGTKYALIFASGEAFDTVYTADWSFYADQASKGGFLQLNMDQLSKGMPDYYKLVPPEFWNQVKVGGKIYMIPYLNRQVVGHELLLIRGDLRQKYGLAPVATLGDLETYFAAIKKNESGMLGFDGTVGDLQQIVSAIYYKQPNNLMFLKLSPQVFTVKLDDPEGAVMYALDDPAYLQVLKKAKQLADAGVWSQNILAQKTGGMENFIASRSASFPGIGGMDNEYSKVIALHPDWKLEVLDLQPDKIHEASSATRSGMGIHATSKNVPRTLAMLNLFGTKRDYYDLTTYGIVGKHFEPVGDRRLKVLEDGAKLFAPKANSPWGWERIDWIRYDVSVPDELINMQTTWIQKGLASKTPLVSFGFVDTSVKNELAACDNIFKSRGVALLAGLVDNPEAELASLKADLKAAGIDKVRAEVQRQVTEYLKSLR